ncbi:MAG: biosynthetic arginine decarboxylase [Myxococcales bacterium]|nr:biosynthetic arginine decarboxylase [Myxococcales bacterium]
MQWPRRHGAVHNPHPLRSPPSPARRARRRPHRAHATTRFPMASWTVQESRELYGLSYWGDEYFGVNDAGHVVVKPRGGDGPGIDLLSLVGDLQRRGLRTPLLIRFSDILASRIASIGGAFQYAIDEYEYKGRWRGVYPIKVNQQRHVVEEIVEHGAAFGVGLEAGSKPELLVALAVLETPGATIVCNGYKDRAYLETALLAQRLGRRPIIVIDRFRELELLIKTSKELGIRPHIGVRAKMWTRGAGKWIESTGSRSKFGLSPAELVAAVERLRGEDMLDCLELLHCHIGSQITAIRAHKEAVREISRIYVGLREIGAGLTTIDVGGGLGVDYDGSQSDDLSSMNYSIQEYANDVVATIQDACEEAGQPHPDIITESGRAMVAHHSVLVFDVLGVHEMTKSGLEGPVDENDEKVLVDLAEVRDGAIDEDNVYEAYHDAQELRDQAASLFSLGYLDLTARARAERLYFQCCERILAVARGLEEPSEELDSLERELADTYYGNFSVFQSAPDHWAVDQLFPVMPIHRLDEEPNRRGVFADLTCDSDGKIDRFIGNDGVRAQLPLHAWNGEPYYVGVFLVGAYQEILGDLHNLFGDTDAVHVRVEDDGRYAIEHEVEGDEVSEVLHYVQYDRHALIEKVRRTIERALRDGDIGLEDSARLRKRYEQGLTEYTYLSRDDD